MVAESYGRPKPRPPSDGVPRFTKRQLSFERWFILLLVVAITALAAGTAFIVWRINQGYRFDLVGHQPRCVCSCDGDSAELRVE